MAKKNFNLGAEALSDHNDGWAKQRILEWLNELSLREQNQETKEYIARILKKCEGKKVEKN